MISRNILLGCVALTISACGGGGSSSGGVVNPPTPKERAFIMKVDSNKKQCGHSGCTYKQEFTVKVEATDNAHPVKYNIDCNSDGVKEGTNITGNYTCRYASKGEYRISLTGSYPHILTTGRVTQIEQWGSQKWGSMASSFMHAKQLDITATDKPDLSHVSDVSRMFYGSSFDPNGNVRSLSNWNMGNIKNMSFMFAATQNFNLEIGSWDVSNVSNMGNLFLRAAAFNQDIGNWNVANVKNMSNLFKFAYKFNQNISQWNVANVSTMSGMFEQAIAFNQPIAAWNVSNVRDMHNMFSGAKSFNRAIGNWNVAKVKDMSAMFSQSNVFNQSIANWNVGNVVNMSSMFHSAKAFNQDLSAWNVSHVKNMQSMFEDSGLKTNNYDKLLNSWSSLNLKKAVRFSAGNTKYSQSAKVSRDYLRNQFGWIITDGGQL